MLCARARHPLAPAQVPPALNRFSRTLDKNMAESLFKVLLKYRPEDKAAKKQRLLAEAEARAAGAWRQGVCAGGWGALCAEVEWGVLYALRAQGSAPGSCGAEPVALQALKQRGQWRDWRVGVAARQPASMASALRRTPGVLPV